MTKKLIVIIGPTAIGKTACAIALAQKLQTEIISYDSRQFYKEMTIGTAVPTTEELNAVPHHFIHNKSIFDNFSVGDFEREATDLLAKLFQKHDYLVLVGGSGLYEKTVTEGLDTFPEVSPEIREDLNQQLVKNGLVYLQEKLKLLDPDYYQKIDIQNPHRVIRALEIVVGSGLPFSSFLQKKNTTRPFDTIKIGLELPREKLYQRINQRVDIMMENGLLLEAESLKQYRDLNPLKTVGYKELFDFFDQTTTLNFAIEEIKKNTRRYAKRQMTWYRNSKAIKWLDANDNNLIDKCLEHIHS